jgi:hypothetical protein
VGNRAACTHLVNLGPLQLVHLGHREGQDRHCKVGRERGGWVRVRARTATARWAEREYDVQEGLQAVQELAAAALGTRCPGMQRSRGAGKAAGKAAPRLTVACCASRIKRWPRTVPQRQPFQPENRNPMPVSHAQLRLCSHSARHCSTHVSPDTTRGAGAHHDVDGPGLLINHGPCTPTHSAHAHPSHPTVT